jgi:hypothetical protein
LTFDAVLLHLLSACAQLDEVPWPRLQVSRAAGFVYPGGGLVVVAGWPQPSASGSRMWTRDDVTRAGAQLSPLRFLDRVVGGGVEHDDPWPQLGPNTSDRGCRLPKSDWWTRVLPTIWLVDEVRRRISFGWGSQSQLRLGAALAGDSALSGLLATMRVTVVKE